jgi:hypothetical protein
MECEDFSAAGRDDAERGTQGRACADAAMAPSYVATPAAGRRDAPGPIYNYAASARATTNTCRSRSHG